MTNISNIVLKALNELKAININNIEVEDITTITDNIIIATGTSSTHVKAIANNVVNKLKDCNQSIIGVEGIDTSEWILIDIGDIVVHVMQATAREYYQLEKLWTPISKTPEFIAHA